MLKIITEFFYKKTKRETVFICFLLLILLGFLDHLTGYELSFSVFYLAPIALATWYVGKKSGLIISIASAAVWFVVEFTSGHYYSNDVIIFWNVCVRLAFFIITSHLLFKLKTALTNEQLLARRDSLTGIMNSRAFEDIYNQITELASRYNHSLALGYIDVDDFKKVNDSFGHSEGDRLLRDIANTISSSIRSSDFVGRLGGDEFAVLLPETDYEGAKKLFNKIRLQLVELTKNTDIKFGTSIGVAIFHKFMPPADDALKLVDKLMYKMKDSGKNDIFYENYYQK